MMRAKLQLCKIEPSPGNVGEKLSFSAVSSAAYGPNGENEDNMYSRWTPTADLTIFITNPDLIGKFVINQKFYLDFTLAKE